MATILRATETGDGTVILHIDVAADTIATIAVPTWLHLAGESQPVADAYAARYAARRHRQREGTP